jgi:hypothetical protein
VGTAGPSEGPSFSVWRRIDIRQEHKPERRRASCTSGRRRASSSMTAYDVWAPRGNAAQCPSTCRLSGNEDPLQRRRRRPRPRDALPVAAERPFDSGHDVKMGASSRALPYFPFALPNQRRRKPPAYVRRARDGGPSEGPAVLRDASGSRRAHVPRAEGRAAEKQHQPEGGTGADEGVAPVERARGRERPRPEPRSGGSRRDDERTAESSGAESLLRVGRTRGAQGLPRPTLPAPRRGQATAWPPRD